MRAVLGVLTGRKLEKRVHTDAVEVRDFFEQFTAIFDGLDLFEFVLQWPDAHGFDRLLIHAASVVVAYLLRLRRESRIDLCVFRFFRDVM